MINNINDLNEDKVIANYKDLSENFIKDEELKNKVINKIRNNEVQDIPSVVTDKEDNNTFKTKNKNISIIFARTRKIGKESQVLINSVSQMNNDMCGILENILDNLKNQSINYEVDFINKEKEMSIFTFKGNVVNKKHTFFTDGIFYGLGINSYNEVLMNLRSNIDILITINENIESD